MFAFLKTLLCKKPQIMIKDKSLTDAEKDDIDRRWNALGVMNDYPASQILMKASDSLALWTAIFFSNQKVKDQFFKNFSPYAMTNYQNFVRDNSKNISPEKGYKAKAYILNNVLTDDDIKIGRL
jgi:hypothetical protein